MWVSACGSACGSRHQVEEGCWPRAAAQAQQISSVTGRDQCVGLGVGPLCVREGRLLADAQQQTSCRCDPARSRIRNAHPATVTPQTWTQANPSSEDVDANVLSQRVRAVVVFEV